ncbi:branched-chain amino acid transport system substrate-binding protein [Desulfonatronum thiosulfatophilum]|uniref:Branched-chain amino acid transport system substrate-binding protein n=1 Tax=Desulfonatronum thiosulfatophilum TaxID=617002 RepID=A0A1G6BXV3_9BACT|nr:ABC transporter substrate-binding protein [Desulfonatronum thiosulfatophilum]SDB25471.1 branched-chain amino acid transport system substrate-binding protein [Desulfonatronum thiosulfatophilum]
MSAKSWMKTVTAACLLVLVCSPAWAQKIKIAVAAPLTGPAASYGENIKSGVETKVEEINAAGGINGTMVEVAYFDELCEPREAAVVAPRIVGDRDIVGVVGHVCSSAHLAALPTYVRMGMPVISPTATNVTISQQNKDNQGRVWSFRNVYLDDYQGKFLANYVKDVLGLEKIAVFYENNDYGIGLKNAFVTEAKNIGLTVVGEEGYVKGATDFTPQLTSLRRHTPDGLFISGYYNEGALIAAQAANLGMDVIKFGADGLDNVDYINLGGAAANNTYMTVPFLADAAPEQAQDFIKKFEEKYQRDLDWMSANAYDAAGKFAAAVAAVGTDRTAIRDFLAGINSEENAYIGITGATYFNEIGDPEKSAFVKMVKDGQFVAAPKQMQ